MKTLICAALAVAALGLSSCAAFSAATGGGQSAIPSQLLDNLSACRRIYTASTGLGATLTVHIECDPQTKLPAAVAAVE